MEKATLQSDLFEVVNDSAGLPSAGRYSFLERFRISLRLDQALLAMIGILILNIFIYTFGIEAGKRSVAGTLDEERLKHRQVILEMTRQMKAAQPVTKEQNMAASLPAVAPPAIPPISGTSAVMENTDPIAKSSEDKAENPLPQPLLAGKYTIQIVTYTSQAQATQFIAKLKEKGLDGFVIPSGRFFQVCANAFETRKLASATLSRLQADRVAPRDAYVRSLPTSLAI